MARSEGLGQLVRGLSEAEFRGRFGTEEACRRSLLEMRWREGLTCPACGHGGFCELKGRKVYQCNRCKKQVSLTAGTVFQDTKLPLTVWFLAIYLLIPPHRRSDLVMAWARGRMLRKEACHDRAHHPE
jgi:DNA-directed RNA polymerase subunit RPC12/RpoP